MGYGECHLNASYGLHGCNATVSLIADWEAIAEEPLRLTVEFARREGVVRLFQWDLGAQFGAAYVWDHFPERRGRHLKVHIQRILGHMGLASSLSVAYVTVFALYQALNWKPEIVPRFDLDRGEFIFPAWKPPIDAIDPYSGREEKGVIFEVYDEPPSVKGRIEKTNRKSIQ